jgi:hypothetical protein
MIGGFPNFHHILETIAVSVHCPFASLRSLAHRKKQFILKAHSCELQYTPFYSSPVNGEARKLGSLTSFKLPQFPNFQSIYAQVVGFDSETGFLHLNISKNTVELPSFPLNAHHQIRNSVQSFHLTKIAPLCPLVASIFLPFRNVLHIHLFHKVAHCLPPHSRRLEPTWMRDFNRFTATVAEPYEPQRRGIKPCRFRCSDRCVHRILSSDCSLYRGSVLAGMAPQKLAWVFTTAVPITPSSRTLAAYSAFWSLMR